MSSRCPRSPRRCVSSRSLRNSFIRARHDRPRVARPIHFSQEPHMSDVFALWLPTLISAVIVFVVSSVIHMVTPWHKNDYKTLPNEDGVMTALRGFGLPPGDYMMPRPSSMEEMRSPAFAEKVKLGPRVIMTVLPPGSFGMAKNLIGWFVYLLVVGCLAGCMGALALPPGAHDHDVFHVVLLAAFLGYGVALWQMTIWYNRSIWTTIRSTIDAGIYGLITAGVFMYFWPR